MDLNKLSIIKKLTRISALIFLVLWIVLTLWPSTKIKENSPALFYSSECEDRLFYHFINAINKAKHDIHLVIYALTDKKVIHALNRASLRGVRIKVIYDKKTEGYEIALLSDTIDKVAIISSALMHQKLLVIDQEKIFIGSANFTSASLRLHDNLVIEMQSKKVATRLINQSGTPYSFEVGGQFLEFYSFPGDQTVGLSRLLTLLDEAKESLIVGMFTWTYPPLTEAIINAHKRGVQVSVILDQQTAFGASKKTRESLLEAGIAVRLGTSYKLFHHKFVLIDNNTLATGSANWTKAAFFRNQDCLLIVHGLTRKQREKMKRMNKIIRCYTTKC